MLHPQVSNEVNQTINHVEQSINRIVDNAAHTANELASNITKCVNEIVSNAASEIIRVEQQFYQDANRLLKEVNQIVRKGQVSL